MYISKEQGISTGKKSQRILHSDSHQTSLVISDQEDEFDGLWSYGFRLFDSILFGNRLSLFKKNFFSRMVLYYAHFNISYRLLRKNCGLILSIEKKPLRLFKGFQRTFRFNYKISTPYTFKRVNEKTILIEYSTPEREGFGHDKLYMYIAIPDYCDVKTIKKGEDGLSITVKFHKFYKETPVFYMYYHPEEAFALKNFTFNRGDIKRLINQHVRNAFFPFQYTTVNVSNKVFHEALLWSIFSGSQFVMEKNNMIGIWAGYPWFDNNWGRDTFIALSGISIVTGRYEQAWHVIETFINYQNLDKKSPDYGKIPNVIFREDNIMYNTGDGTPLLIRGIYEYYLYTADIGAIIGVWENIHLAIKTNYLDKCDKYGFIGNEDADDWMDARIEGEDSISPRGSMQVEIQALWYTALITFSNMTRDLIRYAKKGNPLPDSFSIKQMENTFKTMARAGYLLKKSFTNYFITEEAPYIYDHLNKDYSKDMKIRPNFMLAFYYSNLKGIPRLINKETLLNAFKYSLRHIVYKHGVSSLSKEDEDFHPFHISDMHHKDAAYHNGAIWGWLSGSFIHTAAFFQLSNFAFEQSLSLSKQILSSDALGTLSELVEPFINKKVNPSGAFSQAWSVSEFTRSFYQDYLGVKPDVPKRDLYIMPSLPLKMGKVSISLRFGLYETISLTITPFSGKQYIRSVEASAISLKKPINVYIKIPMGYVVEGDKYIYRDSYFDVLLTKTDDSFNVCFKSLESGSLKLKELQVEKFASLVSQRITNDIYNKKIDEGISFASPLTEDFIETNKSCNIKDYQFEKILGENKKIKL